MESERSDESEVMMFRQYALPDTIDGRILGTYTTMVMDGLTMQDVAPKLESACVARYALSDEPCGKLVVRPM